MKNKTIYITLLVVGISLIFTGCGSNNELEELEFLAELNELNKEMAYEEEEEPYEPIERAPTQEELIKEHRVKLMRTDYDDANYNIDHFDKNGLLIKHEYFNGEELTVSEYTYELDAAGNVLKKVTIEEDEKSIHEFRYDDEGREIERQFTYKGGDTRVTTYEYDDELHTKTEKDDVGKYVTQYDNRGLEEEIISYDEQGKMDATIYCTYDESGNKIKEEASVMGIDVIDKMTYNERGQLLRKARGGLVTVLMFYEYDEKGLCTSFDRQQGSAPSKAMYTYKYY